MRNTEDRCFTRIGRYLSSRKVCELKILPLFFQVLTTCDSACSFPEISGTIPPELGRLCSLEGLDLSWNELEGNRTSGAGGQQNKKYRREAR